MSNIHKRGFASLSPERRREIASLGGRSVSPECRSYSRDPELASKSGKKGGRVSGGNFANDPARAAEAGRNGGRISRGNFKHNPRRAAACGKVGGSSK